MLWRHPRNTPIAHARAPATRRGCPADPATHAHQPHGVPLTCSGEALPRLARTHRAAARCGPGRRATRRHRPPAAQPGRPRQSDSRSGAACDMPGLAPRRVGMTERRCDPVGIWTWRGGARGAAKSGRSRTARRRSAADAPPCGADRAAAPISRRPLAPGTASPRPPRRSACRSSAPPCGRPPPPPAGPDPADARSARRE